MRKEIFKAIAQRIKEQVPEIKFIDLWNEHLAEVTATTAFPTPSLFIEFEEYEIHHNTNHVYQANVPIRLHIITRTVAYTAGAADSRIDKALQYFDLIDKVHAALATLSSGAFSTFMLKSSISNHNHAELLESIEGATDKPCGGGSRN